MEFSGIDKQEYLKRIEDIAKMAKTLSPSLAQAINDGKKFMTAEEIAEIESKIPGGKSMNDIQNSLNNLTELIKKARG